MFVRAVYYREKKTVHYFDENNQETLYIGGSFAWRTNNPGNMAKPNKRVVTTFIGLAQRTSTSGMFLIFPDKATGEAERIKLMREVYGKKSIAQMMERYAPRVENDTDGYIDFICKRANVSSDAVINELTPAQFKALAEAMEIKEGYIPGKIVQLGKATKVELKDKLQQPIANKAVQVKAGDKTVSVKTDRQGSMPSIYPSLFAKVDLYYDELSKDAEKIGSVIKDGAANALTFIAPYFTTQSKVEVHETKKPPLPSVHIVRSGETLAGIAGKYGFTAQDFARENKLKDINKIFDRQHLRIPGRSPQSTHGAARPAAATQKPASKPTAAAKPAPATSTKPPAKPPAKPPSKPPVRQTAAPVVAVDRQRSANNHPVTVLSSPTLQHSSKAWCNRFPGSKELSSLVQPFRDNAVKFYKAMEAAKIKVRPNAAFRPPERSYMMYWAWMIAKGSADVTKIPPYPNVPIDWAHRDASGKANVAAAKAAAKEMCAGFGLKWASAKQKVGKPGRSRHNFGSAIDINISSYVGKTMKNASGDDIKIDSWATLVKVGATYNVNYYPKENMHWSDTGR